MKHTKRFPDETVAEAPLRAALIPQHYPECDDVDLPAFIFDAKDQIVAEVNETYSKGWGYEETVHRLVTCYNACDRANLTNAQLDAGVLETREGLLERAYAVLRDALRIKSLALVADNHERSQRFKASDVTHAELAKIEESVKQLLADIGREKEGKADG